MIKVNGKEVQFGTFPNGETKVIHESIKLSAFNKIVFKYTSDEDLLHLIFVKNYIDEFYGTKNELAITYMPYSRMDRSENGSPFTLKYVARLINILAFDKVIVIEPHSDVTCALLEKSEAAYINYDLVEQVKSMVGFSFEDDVIVFPDAGAAKRYSKIPAENIVIGNKKRDFETGRIVSFELSGDIRAKGSLAIIVDDLSSYGGTFVATAKALREKGFEEIFLLVAHAENSIFEGELFSHVDKVFTTDSLITEQNNWENQRFASKLKIFKLEEILNV